MAEVPVDKRFRGSIRLVTLLLWRIAKSTNVEDGFRAARELKMFDAENEAFTRRCFALDAQLEAGEELAEPLTMAVYFFSMPVSITKSSKPCACAAASSNLSLATVLTYLRI